MPTRLSPPVAGLLEGATTFGNRVRVDQWELRRAVTRSLYTELVHPVAKRVRMKVQDPGRALWTVNHSRGLLKGRHDMVSFYLVQRQQWLWKFQVSLPMLRTVRH